jgi:hypothetical protein
MLEIFGDKRSVDSGRRAQDSGAAALRALEELRRECEQPGPELVEQAGQCSQCREELLGIRGKVRLVFISGKVSVVALPIVKRLLAFAHPFTTISLSCPQMF